MPDDANTASAVAAAAAAADADVDAGVDTATGYSSLSQLDTDDRVSRGQLKEQATSPAAGLKDREASDIKEEDAVTELSDDFMLHRLSFCTRASDELVAVIGSVGRSVHGLF